MVKLSLRGGHAPQRPPPVSAPELHGFGPIFFGGGTQIHTEKETKNARLWVIMSRMPPPPPPCDRLCVVL